MSKPTYGSDEHLRGVLERMAEADRRNSHDRTFSFEGRWNAGERYDALMWALSKIPVEESQ